jgi:DNA polymerase
MIGQHLPLTLIEEEPRILDLDLAAALEYTRPTKIRELIKRHVESLEKLGTLPTVGSVIQGARGSTETDEFYLNKAQAIFITTQAGTAKATEITIEVVRRFDAYEKNATLPEAIIENVLYGDVPWSRIHYQGEVYLPFAAISAVYGPDFIALNHQRFDQFLPGRSAQLSDWYRPSP